MTTVPASGAMLAFPRYRENLDMPPLRDDTDRLLRDFLLKESEREAEIKKKVQGGTDKVLQAFQTFSVEIRERLDSVEVKVDQALDEAAVAKRLAMHAHDRHDKLESKTVITKSLWDLGEESPTGTHMVFSKETLRQHDVEKKARLFDGIARQIVAAGVGAAGIVIAAYVTVRLLGFHP
jgi:maltodextrin utilization protein YvdJ